MTGAREALLGFLGALWALSLPLWAVFLALVVLFAPLAAAYAVALLVDGLAPAAALGLGMAFAFVVGISPYDAEDRWSLPLVLLAAVLAWIGWNLRVGPVDVIALAVVLAVAVGGWLVRRAIARRSASVPG